jgi:hypothetical protein
MYKSVWQKVCVCVWNKARPIVVRGMHRGRVARWDSTAVNAKDKYLFTRCILSIRIQRDIWAKLEVQTYCNMYS